MSSLEADVVPRYHTVCYRTQPGFNWYSILCKVKILKSCVERNLGFKKNNNPLFIPLADTLIQSNLVMQNAVQANGSGLKA